VTLFHGIDRTFRRAFRLDCTFCATIAEPVSGRERHVLGRFAQGGPGIETRVGLYGLA